MKDHKWDLIFFSFYDRTGMERHLEQRAAQGWLLERIGEIAMRYLLAWIILGGVGLVMNAAWLWSMLRRPIDLLSSAYNLTTGAIWLMLFLWCAADLTGVEDDRYITRSHSDATFLITQREFYQHMFYDQLQPGERFATLDYTIVDVHLPFLYNWCVEQLLHHRDDIRADYAASLLQFTAGRRGSIRAPLAFGEGAARERIENIMKYKRPTGLAVVPAALLCLVLTACLASGV